ncbi:hypothetical protein AB3S75_006449 [Citrus x aurantiifolia]
MHVEKNICESILCTLLDISGKTKDGLNARKDLEDWDIRHDLHPYVEGMRTYLPAAPHSLSKIEKKIFCERLFNMKLPDGYSSNIGNCVSVEECKITNLKSHDYHILMQQLLPVVIRGLLPKGPKNAIFRICTFFNKICQRVVDRENILALEGEVFETVCMFERFFPLAFFDIMVHLSIHLGREVRLCGPVHYRWMYPFERQMKEYKGYVRNRGRPEGCIAECYLAEECVAFCSGYIQQRIKVNTKELRNDDFSNGIILEGRPISRGTPITLSSDMLESAHRYVLFNTAVVELYLEMHLEELKQSNKCLAKNSNLLWKRHVQTFSAWLKQKIEFHTCTNKDFHTLKWLAYGPRINAKRYSGYIINGQRFHTREIEKATQDSGVSIEATTVCRASAKDNAQVVDVVAYYGVITDIILLDYHNFQLPLFKCDWANKGHGVKVDDGFTLVNLHQGQSQYEKEPFILASQAKQVFYSRDSNSSNWYVLLKAPPRGYYELEMYDEKEDTNCVLENMLDKNIEDDNEGAMLCKF